MSEKKHLSKDEIIDISADSVAYSVQVGQETRIAMRIGPWDSPPGGVSVRRYIKQEKVERIWFPFGEKTQGLKEYCFIRGGKIAFRTEKFVWIVDPASGKEERIDTEKMMKIRDRIAQIYHLSFLSDIAYPFHILDVQDDVAVCEFPFWEGVVIATVCPATNEIVHRRFFALDGISFTMTTGPGVVLPVQSSQWQGTMTFCRITDEGVKFLFKFPGISLMAAPLSSGGVWVRVKDQLSIYSIREKEPFTIILPDKEFQNLAIVAADCSEDCIALLCVDVTQQQLFDRYIVVMARQNWRIAEMYGIVGGKRTQMAFCDSDLIVLVDNLEFWIRRPEGVVELSYVWREAPDTTDEVTVTPLPFPPGTENKTQRKNPPS